MINDRGLSNTLGYVLLFAFVLASITAAHTFGVSALEGSRDTTISQNAALSMESMSDAIDDLRKQNTTTRLSIIRGSGGTLSSGGDTTITIEVAGVQEYQRTLRPIVFHFKDTEIVYEAGALIRTQENGGAILIDGAEYQMNDGAVILPVMATYSADGGSVNAQTVTTYIEKNHSSLDVYRTGTTDTVLFRIETTAQRAPVWKEMMEDRIGDPNACSITPPGSGTVECTSTIPSGPGRSIIVRDVRFTYEFVT